MFAERYMAKYVERHHKPRTIGEERRLLDLHILPALGRLRLRDVGKADVARLQAKMHATPIAANRALALLSAMLGWAEPVGYRRAHRGRGRGVFCPAPRERATSPALVEMRVRQSRRPQLRQRSEGDLRRPHAAGGAQAGQAARQPRRSGRLHGGQGNLGAGIGEGERRPAARCKTRPRWDGR
jgi:hypothetical protein